ncbi:hypothetical protein PoB_005639800 [Plakobranchus ocellatus]|uniref:Uncharacterized protein n=1 Tax=Plakobranchus ocellatus TaxID=259542 RepID=A0AAV4CFY1_9GAST|nr:hypothetical protein PoB_005639800 [Plakobranchus ocellatus]
MGSSVPGEARRGIGQINRSAFINHHSKWKLSFLVTFAKIQLLAKYHCVFGSSSFLPSDLETSFTMPCHSGSLVLLLTVLLTVAMETHALYFTACWGWGPSCSRHEVPRPVKPPQRKAPASLARTAVLKDSRKDQSSPSSSLSSSSSSSSGVQRGALYGPLRVRGFPSIVTSGGWEPGFMGKRNSPNHKGGPSGAASPRDRRLLKLLQCLVGGGVGSTVACESALRSAGTLLSRVRAPPGALA